MTMRTAAAHLMLAECRPQPLNLPFLRGDKSAGETEDIDVAIDMVTYHRNLACRHYDNCLTHAAGKGWPSFTCRGCVLRTEGT